MNIVTPILKNSNLNMTKSANYRGINHSSLFGTLLERILLTRYNSLLDCSDFQFGFREGCSTDSCTLMLKETIAQYTSEGSPVYVVFLDATKAFDRVNYTIHFDILKDRLLPKPILRYLANYFLNQSVRISWNGILSETFSVENGLKQGGILSPSFFNLYIDKLLVPLNTLRAGCFVGSKLVGCLAFADDLTLLAPTPAAMRLLLKNCEVLARELHIKFNMTKTKMLYFPPRGAGYPFSMSCSFSLCGQVIEKVDSWSHLGHLLTSSQDDSQDILRARRSLINQINNVLAIFTEVSSTLRFRLLYNYCSSWYGSILWDCSNTHIELIARCWRKGLRRAVRLPLTTHNVLINCLWGQLPFINQVSLRQINFFLKPSLVLTNLLNLGPFMLFILDK